MCKDSDWGKKGTDIRTACKHCVGCNMEGLLNLLGISQPALSELAMISVLTQTVIFLSFIFFPFFVVIWMRTSHIGSHIWYLAPGWYIAPRRWICLRRALLGEMHPQGKALTSKTPMCVPAVLSDTRLCIEMWALSCCSSTMSACLLPYLPPWSS